MAPWVVLLPQCFGTYALDSAFEAIPEGGPGSGGGAVPFKALYVPFAMRNSPGFAGRTFRSFPEFRDAASQQEIDPAVLLHQAELGRRLPAALWSVAVPPAPGAEPFAIDFASARLVVVACDVAHRQPVPDSGIAVVRAAWVSDGAFLSDAVGSAADARARPLVAHSFAPSGPLLHHLLASSDIAGGVVVDYYSSASLAQHGAPLRQYPAAPSPTDRQVDTYAACVWWPTSAKPSETRAARAAGRECAERILHASAWAALRFPVAPAENAQPPGWAVPDWVAPQLGLPGARLDGLGAYVSIDSRWSGGDQRPLCCVGVHQTRGQTLPAAVHRATSECGPSSCAVADRYRLVPWQLTVTILLPVDMARQTSGPPAQAPDQLAWYQSAEVGAPSIGLGVVDIDAGEFRGVLFLPSVWPQMGSGWTWPQLVDKLRAKARRMLGDEHGQQQRVYLLPSRVVRPVNPPHSVQWREQALRAIQHGEPGGAEISDMFAQAARSRR